MKILERRVVGYSHEALERTWQSMSYGSASKDAPCPVCGICFASEPNREATVTDFVESMNLGVVAIEPCKITSDEWGHLLEVLRAPSVQLHKVCLLVHDLEQAPFWLQRGLADCLLAFGREVPCFATAADAGKLLPDLASQFLLYLGTGASGKMRFGLGDQQSVSIAEGSLRHPGSE